MLIPLHTCTLGLPKTNLRYEPKKTIVDSYGNWLNTFEWNFYCTFTTSYSLSDKSARRAIVKLHEASVKEYGSFKIFWVSEPFDSKEGFHTHALVKVPNDFISTASSTIEKKWHQVSKTKKTRGRFKTHIMPYIKEMGANFYVSKYLFRNNSDHDIFF